MRTVLILLFILFCTLLDGQNQISIRIYYSPDICYRYIRSDSYLVGIDDREENEIMKYGNSFGIGIIYQFTPMFAMEFGIQYMTRGYQTKKIEVITPGPYPGIPDQTKDIYSFNYLGFPFRLNFMLGRYKRLRFRSSIGLITNILLRQEWENILYYSDQTDISIINMTDDYNETVITTVLCFGLGYIISNSFEIQVKPMLQYDILSVIDATIKTYLWNFGLNLSLIYYL